MPLAVALLDAPEQKPQVYLPPELLLPALAAEAAPRELLAPRKWDAQALPAQLLLVQLAEAPLLFLAELPPQVL